MITPREVAIHEAGHAYAAMALGCGPVASATIAPWQPGFLGLVTYKKIPGRWPPSRREVEHELIVTLAGMVAERLDSDSLWAPYGIDWEHPCPDAKHARRYAAMLGSRNERDAILEQALERAINLIRGNWPAVDAIARGLLADPTGTLMADELKAIVERHHLFGPLAELVA